MIPRPDRELDPTDHDTPLDPRLITDIQRAYRHSPPLDAVDAAIRLAVAARAAQQEVPVRRGRSRRLLPRLSVPLTALVVLAVGLGTYLHGQGPIPVSAQTVLHRAAAAGPGANMATRATYKVSSSDGSTGTADVWIGYSASGTASQLALTLTMDGQSGGSVGLTVVGPGLTQLYGLGSGQVRAPSAPPPQNLGATGTCRGTCVPAPSTSTPGSLPPAVRARAMALSETLRGIVVGTLLAQRLSAQPTAFTLRQETVNGVSVYALQTADAPGITYYFNAQSYELQGADWTQGGSSWHAWLTGSSTVPLSAVPSGTFGSATQSMHCSNSPQTPCQMPPTQKP